MILKDKLDFISAQTFETKLLHFKVKLQFVFMEFKLFEFI